MTFLMLLLLLAVALVVGALRVVARDPRGTLPPPSSRDQDPQFRAPSAR